MKSTKEYFPVIMLITLYKVALTFESVDEILSVTIQMKATKQYFLEALFISMYFVVFDHFLYKVVLTFESGRNAEV